ncbi:MAG: NAD+ synthase [Candidatus Omnitrophica bacterium]|nr:NAD+ synthase [Candidatus Omnitrophota bacterium]MCM8802113.1 NAD+ synthase [Candidatus Omnitrophota bacterium]
MGNIKVALCQLNFTVGDILGNTEKIIKAIEKGEKEECNFICFPELSITGYPPEDLLLRRKFIEDNLNALQKIRKNVKNSIVIVGFVNKKNNKVYNSAGIIYKGEIIGIYNKKILPNYGVFDEKRYFSKGREIGFFEINGIKFGVVICEDIWHKHGPYKKQIKNGAIYIFVLNASPYHYKKIKERERIIKEISLKYNIFLFYTNLVGGQDELLFDGQSLAVNNKGQVIKKGKPFEEEILIFSSEDKPIEIEEVNESEEIYKGLICGLRDYVYKNNFKKVVIGLSGGIDSALTATIAVDALGKENVIGIFMPSRFSSPQSYLDAKKLAKNLGIEFKIISIEKIFNSYLETLKDIFQDRPFDITEENIQARIRGNILMALSNKFGYLVLTTGNKSEMSVGYATLYGDMAGGFAVIKDLYKTMVYKIAKWRNSISPVIPENIFIKEPTAELKENQKDTDTLPPYEVLDSILKEYIENDKSYEEIVNIGFDENLIKKVLKMVDRNEYKRRQSPPGIKITPKAFGKDRRMPIINKYLKWNI